GYAFEEVRNRPIRELFLPEGEPEGDAFAGPAPGAGPALHESYWLTRDGERRLIAWSSTALAASPESPEYTIVTGLDVTERKRLESQLLRAQRMESIGTLAGGIAHDLNNIFSPILTSIQ